MSNTPRGAILCVSRHGATQQYAEWLSKKLSLQIFNPDKEFVRLMSYDFLVIGTPVYNGQFLISKWLNNHQQELASKKLFFFVVGASAVSVAQIQVDDVFFLPGRITLQRLSWRERMFLRLTSRYKDMDQVDIRHLADILRTLTQYCEPQPSDSAVAHGDSV